MGTSGEVTYTLSRWSWQKRQMFQGCSWKPDQGPLRCVSKKKMLVCPWIHPPHCESTATNTFCHLCIWFWFQSSRYFFLETYKECLPLCGWLRCNSHLAYKTSSHIFFSLTWQFFKHPAGDFHIWPLENKASPGISRRYTKDAHFLWITVVSTCNYKISCE